MPQPGRDPAGAGCQTVRPVRPPPKVEPLPMKSPSMLRGLLSFSSMTMVSRVLGLVRDMSINAAFGATGATDAFWVAFRIPNFMRRLFAEGSFSTAFVPVFTEVKEKGTHAQLKDLMARVSGTLGDASSGAAVTAVARLLGCADPTASGPRPLAEGSTVPALPGSAACRWT